MVDILKYDITKNFNIIVACWTLYHLSNNVYSKSTQKKHSSTFMVITSSGTYWHVVNFIKVKLISLTIDETHTGFASNHYKQVYYFCIQVHNISDILYLEFILHHISSNSSIIILHNSHYPAYRGKLKRRKNKTKYGISLFPITVCNLFNSPWFIWNTVNQKFIIFSKQIFGPTSEQENICFASTLKTNISKQNTTSCNLS